MRKSSASNAASNNVIRNIKTEATTDASNDGVGVSKYHCEICKKQFSGTTPLAFHYCKHFYKDLQNLNFPEFIEDTRCTKCEKTFPDKKAMLCHIDWCQAQVHQHCSCQQWLRQASPRCRGVHCSQHQDQDREANCCWCCKQFEE